MNKYIARDIIIIAVLVVIAFFVHLIVAIERL